MKSLSKSLINIRRTPYQSMAAILVLTITFFVAILIGYVTTGFYQALSYFETRPQILVFFKTDAKTEEINALQKSLGQNPQVSSVTYVAQEEALNIYKNLNKNDPLLLELVTADILPASLEVSTTSLDSLKGLSEQLSTSSGVDEVILRSEVVDILNRWLSGIRMAGLIFVSIMAATSILIVMIVVGMKISGKHHEIAILELIGAGPWYIKGPFVFEGAIYGFISSLIAYTTVTTLLLYSTPTIINFAGEVPLLPNSPMILGSVAGISIASGLIIGSFGSWIALKRFLK